MDTKPHEYKIEKSTVELFKLRHPSGMYWADITVDVNGESGRIQIASDYGDWQNYWGHCGMPFKQFLVGLDIDYTAGKFKANDYFDAEHNIKALKDHISELKKSKAITSEDARKCVDEINDVESETTDNSAHFYSLIQNTEYVCRLYYDGFGTVKTIDPGFKAFWENVWPPFINQLKKELFKPGDKAIGHLIGECEVWKVSNYGVHVKRKYTHEELKRYGAGSGEYTFMVFHFNPTHHTQTPLSKLSLKNE